MTREDREMLVTLAAGLEALARGRCHRAARLFARVQAGAPVLLPFATEDDPDEVVDLAEVTALCKRARRDRQ